MSAGHPRLPMKRKNAAKNDWIDKSLADSRCTAFVAKHTNIQIQPFLIRHAHAVKLLMSQGPAQSNPVVAKSLVNVVSTGDIEAMI